MLTRPLAVLVVLTAACASTASVATPRWQAAVSSSAIVFDTVRLRSGPDTLSAFTARPNRSGRFQAIIVLHANRLSEPYIASTVAMLAEAGFVAMAVDIFHFVPGNASWEAAQTADRKAVNDSLNNGFREPRFLRNVQSGMNYLRAQSFVVDGGIGVIGFCGGGWNALLLAAQSKDIGAVVAFYAPLSRSDAQHRSPIELAQFITVPVQYHYALNDQFISAAEVDQFGSMMKRQGTRFERFDYNAQHGFFAHNRQGVFDEADATAAWTRLVPFLRKYAGRALRERTLAPRRAGLRDPGIDAAAHHALHH